jgi:outer membrane protein assembly factor BamD (BamD/ComL family)
LSPESRVSILAPALALLLCAAGPPAPAAEPPDDDRPLDARTFTQGIDAVKQGKRDEGIRILRKLSQDFPDSPFASQALLKAADLIYPVASWDQVGSASAQAIKEASDLLLTLSQKYRSSREAPKALVKLGYLFLEPANPKADLDEACGRFATAAQVYPDSDSADDAYFGSGMCETLRGRPALSADFFARLMDESPASPLAAEALYRYGVALSHLDDPTEAMLALERVRTRYADSRFAPRALDRITLLHRLRLQPALLRGGAAAKPTPPPAQRIGAPPAPAPEADLYRLDASYGAPPATRAASTRSEDTTFRGASDIAVDAQGLLVLASPKTPGVFRLDPKGRVQERIPHPSPDYVAVGDGLAVYISGGGQIALNAKNWSGPDLKSYDGRPPREFGPVATDLSGRVYLLDPRDNILLIYDRSRRLAGYVRPDVKDGRFVDLAKNEDGGVFVFESRFKFALELTQGKTTRKVNLAGLGATEPVALAADGLGDLYLLDGRSGFVYVASPTGERITVIRPPKEALSRLGEASSVAVDAIGRVYVSGRKGQTVLRFQ